MLFNVLGTMSGTAFDGINFAYVQTNGDDFLEVKHKYYVEYPIDIKCRLYKITKSSALLDVLLLEQDITFFYGIQINFFLEMYSLNKPDFIAFHGQTVIHVPENKITLQLGCPVYLSKLCQINVVSDFRTSDMVYGGHGAPITPIYHLFITKQYQKPLAVINIGGIANITWVLEKEELIAVDSGPGIGLIDKWINKHNDSIFYDEDGKIARSGSVNNKIIDLLFSNEYFNNMNARALDKHFFAVDEFLSGLNIEDGAATLTEFTALAIKNAFDLYVNDKMNIVFLSGGGRKNIFLKERIQKLLSVNVVDIDVTGFDGDSIEAEAMAYIAIRSINGLHFTFPSTTGVKFSQGLTRTTFYKKEE